MLPKQTVNNGLIEVRLFEDADLNHALESNED